MKAAADADVIQWRAASGAAHLSDRLAVEEPLEIQVDTRPVSVTMRTPGHDEELAAGFLFSEGIIDKAGQIASIQAYPRNQSGNSLNVSLAPDVTIDFARLTRHVFASSSCGLCGKATIEAVHQHFPPVSCKLSVQAQLLAALPEKLRLSQAGFDETGGLHAAAIFGSDGGLVVAREDVGRHNAVDKVLGYGLLQNLLPFDRHILVVSGRASFEILQKSLAGRIPVVAAVSAPSSLAMEFARESGQTLAGFVRGDRLNVYSHPERIKFQ